MLVRSTSPSDMAQLPHEEYRRTPGSYDADMVDIRCTVWRLRHCAAFHDSPHYPTTVLLRALRCQLGAMSGIWKVGAA
jgi:hypothetical protein